MKDSFEKISKGLDHLGKICITCEKEISAGDEVVACPRCHNIHHVECWKNKGGCGKTGCPQIAQTIKGERPKGDGPPPPISNKVIAGAIIAVLAIILAAFFWPKQPDPAQGRTKIVFLTESYYELAENLTEIAEEFNANNEQTYVDLQLLPSGGMDTKLVVLIAANQAPDVVAIDYERFEYFSEQEVLLPLGENTIGDPIYGIQHPAQLSKLVVWKDTENPERALEILYYFVERIPQLDLDLLQETTKVPLFGE